MPLSLLLSLQGARPAPPLAPFPQKEGSTLGKTPVLVARQKQLEEDEASVMPRGEESRCMMYDAWCMASGTWHALLAVGASCARDSLAADLFDGMP